MAKKRVTVAYTPVDYDSIPSPNVHEIQYNRNGYPGYQQGWNGKEVSNPKLFYFEGSGQQKSRVAATEPKTNLDQDKPKNMKSQIKRAFSMKKDNNEKETRTRHKPLKKTKSCDVLIGNGKANINGNINDTINFYPGLESMIDSYCDNFGYDGRKENLARKYNSEGANIHPPGYESYLDIGAQTYLNSSSSNISSNMAPPHLPTTKDPHSNMLSSILPPTRGAHTNISPNIPSKRDSPAIMASPNLSSNKELHPNMVNMSPNIDFINTSIPNKELHTPNKEILAPYMSYVSLNRESHVNMATRVPPQKEPHNRELTVNTATYTSPQKEIHTRESHVNIATHAPPPINNLPHETHNRESNVNMAIRVPPYKEPHNNSVVSPSYHIPVTVLDPISPEFKNDLSFNLISRVPSNVKENGLPISNPGIPKTVPVVSNPSPHLSPSRKVPPPVKPKPKKKVPHLNAVVEEETEKPSIPALIDLCENILVKLNSWKETKEKAELVSLLEELIALLMGMLRRKPSMTESIASALDSFSFLTSDDDNDDIISLAEENFTSVKLPYKMHIFYAAILHHLSALNDLIIGFQPSSGPLNSKETLYYEKIHQQNLIINELTHLITMRDNVSLKYVCEQFCEPETANVWNSCATNTEPLHCTCKEFKESLKHLFENATNNINNENTDNYLNITEVREGVCSKVVDELCELDIYKTDIKVITVFQFVNFFKNKIKSGTIMNYLQKTVEEFLMLKILYSKDDLLVMSTLQQYWKIPVVKSCIQCLLSFISGDKVSRKGASLHAMTKLHEIPENKSMIVNIIIASLEEGNVKIKSGACITLGKLKVQGISKKLIYLYETDALMREAAEVGLKDLGHNLIRR